MKSVVLRFERVAASDLDPENQTTRVFCPPGDCSESKASDKSWTILLLTCTPKHKTAYGIELSIALHRTLLFAGFFASPHVFPMFSSSFITQTVRLHDYTVNGLPCFLLRWRFHVILVVFSLVPRGIAKPFLFPRSLLRLLPLLSEYFPTVPHSWWHLAKRCRVGWRSWRWSFLFLNFCILCLVRRQVSDPCSQLCPERQESCFPECSETYKNLLRFPDSYGDILFCSSCHAHSAAETEK